MEASRFLPETEPIPPNIVCLKEYSQDKEPIYHFWQDGQETLLTMQRSPFDQNKRECTYSLVFADWSFAIADIHVGQDEASIDFQAPKDELGGDARQEAARLLPGSIDFLKAAVLSDFPELGYFKDEYDRII
jgi:hypothetical protein